MRSLSWATGLLLASCQLNTWVAASPVESEIRNAKIAPKVFIISMVSTLRDFSNCAWTPLARRVT